MKSILKIVIPLVAIAALVLSFVPVEGQTFWSTPECPPNECPQALTGYTYVSTCASDNPGSVCVGWIYERGGQQCHVSALGGI